MKAFFPQLSTYPCHRGFHFFFSEKLSRKVSEKKGEKTVGQG